MFYQHKIINVENSSLLYCLRCFLYLKKFTKVSLTFINCPFLTVSQTWKLLELDFSFVSQILKIKSPTLFLSLKCSKQLMCGSVKTSLRENRRKRIFIETKHALGYALCKCSSFQSSDGRVLLIKDILQKEAFC